MAMNFGGLAIPDGSLSYSKLLGTSFIGTHLVIEPISTYTGVGESFTLTHNGTTFMPQELVSATGNQNSEINWPIFLLKGTYELNFDFVKSNSSGQGRFYIDSTALDTDIFEMYAGSGVASKYKLSGIVVTANGNYTLKLKVPSKNASSTKYDIRFSRLTLVKTA